MNFMTFHILGIIFPTDFHTTNQLQIEDAGLMRKAKTGKTGNRREIDVLTHELGAISVMYIHVLNSELYILNHMCVCFIM